MLKPKIGIIYIFVKINYYYDIIVRHQNKYEKYSLLSNKYL